MSSGDVCFFGYNSLSTSPFFFEFLTLIWKSNTARLLYLHYVQLLPHLLPFMDVALFINATSLIGPGAHFTLWFGAGIRGALTQTKTL